MVLSWATQDALHQVDALLSRRIQLEGHDPAKFQGKNGPSPFLSSTAALQVNDVNASLKLLQGWLQKFVTVSEASEVFNHFMSLAKRYEPLEKKVLVKSDKPSTKDAMVTIDEKYDDSVTFYVLDTMSRILEALLNLESARRAQDILPIESPNYTGSLNTLSPAVEFAFHYLDHSFGSATRSGAAHLLGVLSNIFLGQVSTLFTEKYQQAKKDEQQRDFASYQQAVKSINFGIGDQKRALDTNTYLYELAKRMKDIDRGVLRQEIASSLIVVFQNILDPNDPKRQAEYEKFAATGGQQFESWSNNFKDIYEKTAKWSSKDKHAIFSYELMLRMIVLNKNPDFYLDKKRFDVLGAVVKGLGKKDLRADCLVLLRNYVRDVPESFLKSDMATWSGHARAATSTLFGKKSPKPTDDEIPIMTETLTEIGCKYPTYVLNDVIGDILKPNSEYYTRIKNIALTSLGQITKSKKSSDSENNGLAPLLLPYIEDARNSTNEKQITLMKAALQCWPAVRGTSQSQIQGTAAVVISLTLHDDREVSTLAVSCLQQYVLLDMNAYYLQTVHCLIDQLNEVDPTQPISILKTCNNLIVLLQTLVDYQTTLPKGSKPFEPSADAMLALREHLEAVSLVRLTHTEGWVRTEILRVLLKLNIPALSVFEQKSNLRSPRLVESLLPNHADSDNVPSTSDIFYLPLRKLITTPSQFKSFTGVISSAWSYLARTINTLAAIDAGERLGDDWTQLFKNEYLFLCLAVRPGDSNAAPVSGMVNTNRATLSQAELLLRLQQRRDRLNKQVWVYGEVNQFFETSTAFLQSSNANNYSNQLRSIIAADLSLVDASNHGELLKHLRAPLSAPVQEEKPSKKIQQASPKQGFYYHEFTLDLLSRLLIHVNPDQYHSGVTLLTKTVDDLVAQWSTDSVDELKGLSTLARFYIASLFTRFIFYRTVPQQNSSHLTKSDLMARRNFFFSRLASLLNGSIDSAEQQTKLESAVLSGVSALLALGPIGDAALGNNVLSFLENQLTLQTPTHISNGVTLAMQLFFRLNPDRLTDFICYTLPEVHDPQSPHFIMHGVYNQQLKKKGEPIAPRPTTLVISQFYVRALSAGFAQDFSLWTEERGVTSAEMLLVALLLMSSTDAVVRQAALILVQEILNHDGVTLEDVHLFSPTAPYMYTPGTIALAQAIAYQPSYLTQVPAVCKRAVDLFSHVTESKKEILLRLLRPFAAQFAPLVRGLDSVAGSRGTADTMAVVDGMLDSFFSVTRYCSTSGILGQSLKELWIAVLSIDPITPQLVAYVCTHLVAHYNSLLTEASVANGGSVASSGPAASHSAVGSAATTPNGGATPTKGNSRSASIDAGTGKALSAAAAAAQGTPTSASAKATAGRPSVGDKKLSDITEAQVVPKEIVSTRDILLEKALLRMIATHLSRGSHGMLIVEFLIKQLRSVADECPTEPQKFLDWFNEHQPAVEPTTNTERSAFELIVNTLFERTQSELEPHLPTLLLNAYVLFPGSQLSDDLLKNVSLALRILDVKQSPDAVINEAFFINNLSATYPELRAHFSQVAFIWSINSRDPAIAGAAFRIFYELEEQSFSFGQGQSTLIRIVELVYACLKNKDHRRLKSVIQTCLLPTEQQFDQQGWSALLSASIALLSSQDVSIYQQGLQLFQHLFKYPSVSTATKKAWLVEMGDFISIDGNGEVDASANALLFRGLTHPLTVDDTLAVLQTLMDHYADTGSLASRNQLGMSVQLMNVLLRCVELNQIASDKAKIGVQLTDAQLALKEKNRIRSVSALSNLSVSLFHSADTESSYADDFNALANIFKNVGLSLASTLQPALPADQLPPEISVGQDITAAEKQARQLESSRAHLMKELIHLAQTSGPVETVGALSPPTIPAAGQLMIPFFRSFATVYDSQEHFDFVINFLQRVLQRGSVSEWRPILLMMLGRFLLETQYTINIDAFVPLSEIVAQAYYTSDKDEQHLAENLAFVLVKRRGTGQAKSTEVFNLIRTRASLRKAALSNTALNSPDEKIDMDTILNGALNRFQRTAFPALQEMNAQSGRSDKNAHQSQSRILKFAPTPSILKSNNNAAQVATEVAIAGQWRDLDRLLSSGVHGGSPIALDKIDLNDSTPKSPVNKGESDSEDGQRIDFISVLEVAAKSTRQVYQPENPFAAAAEDVPAQSRVDEEVEEDVSEQPSAIEEHEGVESPEQAEEPQQDEPQSENEETNPFA